MIDEQTIRRAREARALVLHGLLDAAMLERLRDAVFDGRPGTCPFDVAAQVPGTPLQGKWSPQVWPREAPAAPQARPRLGAA